MEHWTFTEDASTHSESGRCGCCGHAIPHHRHGENGRHSGQCTVTMPTGDPCACRTGHKMTRAERTARERG